MKTKLFLSILFTVQLQLSFAQSWQQKSAHFDATVNGIAWITAADDVSAYAISQDLINELVITRDGGATWHAQVIPDFGDSYFTGADAASANTVYVLGQNVGFESNGFFFGGGSKVMKSTDGGKTWVRKGANIYTDSTASYADLIFFCTASSGVTFGDPQDGYFEIYTTSNGGNAWSRVPAGNIPEPLPNEFGTLFFGDKLGNTVWVGTVVVDDDFNLTGARLLQSDDKGATWYVRNSSMPVTGWDLVMRFSSPSVGLIKNNGNLYRTTDGGTTWNQVNYSGTYFGYCFDNVPGSPGTWISTGGDENWLAPDDLAHGLGSSITYDDGDTWTIIDTAVDHTNILITSRTHGYSGGLSRVPGNEGMFVYAPSCDDAGLQVESFSLMNAASDNETAELVDGAVIDLSQRPINVRANLCTSAGVGSVRFRLNGSEYRIENTAPFAIAGDSPTGDYNAWHLAPGDYTLTAIPSSGSNGSGTQGVARSVTFTIISGGSKNALAENMHPTVESSTMTMNAFPNPFTDRLTFEFSVPGDAQVSLELYNISGQRVATVFEGKVTGTEINRHVFYAGELASGLYLYRLKTNDAVVTEKVMLAR